MLLSMKYELFSSFPLAQIPLKLVIWYMSLSISYLSWQRSNLLFLTLFNKKKMTVNEVK